MSAYVRLCPPMSNYLPFKDKKELSITPEPKKMRRIMDSIIQAMEGRFANLSTRRHKSTYQASKLHTAQADPVCYFKSVE